MKNITILGAPGSIGVSTLDVVVLHRNKFSVFALTAHSQVERLYTQCLQFQPVYAVMVDEQSAQKLKEKLARHGADTIVLSGVEGLTEVAAHNDVDYVMAAIVGAAGLLPTLAAVKRGKRILLANKEALVMSGQIFMDAVQEYGAELLPVDSEHNAIFQSMPENFCGGLVSQGIKQIILTASGGPFRDTPLESLITVTPEQACAHPNWAMGKKISVDSATMMNKGLEVIEACWLFNASVEQICVAMHPQSIIHSMVEYDDGSILSQMGQPDMRTPIAHALAWPERIESGVASLDLFEMSQLEFKRPDMKRFPCLQLAYDAMHTGGTQTAILNAANEVAVDAFLHETIGFTDISRIVEKVLVSATHHPASSLEIVLEDDQQARRLAAEYVKIMTSTSQRRAK